MREIFVAKIAHFPDGGRRIVSHAGGSASSIGRAIGFVFCNIVHLTNWIMNGLPERFPGLKVLWIESGLAWLPFMMQRLDNEYTMRSSEAPALKKKPSDYMREMYFST